MRPIIGITTHMSEDERTMQLGRTYSDVMLQMGALPVMIPSTTDREALSMYVQQIDGLILSGGVDVNPALYGEMTGWACGSISPLRDEFELKLSNEMLASTRKPILGICRGFQMLSVALGGMLYQDIQSDADGKTIAHRQKQRSVYTSHPVSLTPGTKLHHIYGSESCMVNSLHHQAVKMVPNGMQIAAVAPDGIIEAAELVGHPFCLGVQWHPEALWNQAGGTMHERLFRAFVDACAAQ